MPAQPRRAATELQGRAPGLAEAKAVSTPNPRSASLADAFSSASAQCPEAPKLEPRDAETERDKQELDRDGRSEGVVGRDSGQAPALDQVDPCRQGSGREGGGGAQKRDGGLVRMSRSDPTRESATRH